MIDKKSSSPEDATKSVIFPMDQDTLKDLAILSQQLEVPALKVVRKALALLNMAQGRKVIFREGEKDFEVDSYEDSPARVKFEEPK